MATLDDLPKFSVGPRTSDLAEIFGAVKGSGYDGVQFVDFPNSQALKLSQAFGFLAAGSGRVNDPKKVRFLAERFADTGLIGATLHVGWGLESDSEAHALIEAILEWSDRLRFPLWPEVHRATVFQDIWRTRQFIERYPTLHLNADFSHWYTGLEMVYGGFDRKLEFIAPVLQKVRFLHGRIGNPGSIQVAVLDDSEKNQPYQQHFETLWTAAMRGFLEQSPPGSVLPFAAELLSPCLFYGREYECAPGELREESDRWEQALRLVDIARTCWASLIAADSRV